MNHKAEAWNKGVAVGQKAPFTTEQVWKIRRTLEIKEAWRDLALFSVGLDSMLRSSDLLVLTVGDVCDHINSVKSQFTCKQQKTGQSVTVGLSKYTRDALKLWLEETGKSRSHYLFTSLRNRGNQPIGRIQYSKLIKSWAKSIRLNPDDYSTHSVRRSLPALIYAETQNIEVIRQLLGQSSVKATSHYLNIDGQHSLDIAHKFRF